MDIARYARLAIVGSIGGIAGAVLYTADVYINGNGVWDDNGYRAAVATGIAGGAPIGSGNPYAVGAGVGVIANGGYYVHDKTQRGEQVDPQTWAVDSVIGGVAGASSVSATPLQAGLISALAGVDTVGYNSIAENKTMSVEQYGIVATISFIGGAVGSRLGTPSGDVTIKSEMNVITNSRFRLTQPNILTLPNKFAGPIGNAGFASNSRNISIWLATSYTGDNFQSFLDWLLGTQAATTNSSDDSSQPQ